MDAYHNITLLLQKAKRYHEPRCECRSTRRAAVELLESGDIMVLEQIVAAREIAVRSTTIDDAWRLSGILWSQA